VKRKVSSFNDSWFMNSFIYLFIFLLTNISVAIANADDLLLQCNPIIKVNESNISLQSLLERLAKEHNFKLEFPKAINKNVSIEVEMPLKKLLQYLTKGMNTGIEFTAIEYCHEPAIFALTIFPVGKETAPVVSANNKIVIKDKPRKKRRKKEYFDIVDMERYVIDVLEGKHKSNVRNMTFEQAQQFRKIRRRIRQEYKKQGRLSELRKKRRQNKGEGNAEDY